MPQLENMRQFPNYGFVRGLSFHNDLAFIGLSKLRRNSSTFGKLPFAEKANEAGVLILHVPTKTLVGKIIYQTSLDEIYDVHVLANKSRPNIMNTLNEEHKQGLTTLCLHIGKEKIHNRTNNEKTSYSFPRIITFSSSSQLLEDADIIDLDRFSLGVDLGGVFDRDFSYYDEDTWSPDMSSDA